MHFAASALAIAALVAGGQGALIRPTARPPIARDFTGVSELPKQTSDATLPAGVNGNVVMNQNHRLYNALPISTPQDDSAGIHQEHILVSRAAAADPPPQYYKDLKPSRRPYTWGKGPATPITSSVGKSYSSFPKLPANFGFGPVNPKKPYGKTAARGVPDFSDLIEDFSKEGAGYGLVVPQPIPGVNVADITVADPFSVWLDSIEQYEAIIRAQNLPSTTLTYTFTLTMVQTEEIVYTSTYLHTPMVTLTFTVPLTSSPALTAPTLVPAAAGSFPAMPTLTRVPIAADPTPSAVAEELILFVDSVPTVGVPPVAAPTSVLTLTTDEINPFINALPSATTPSFPADNFENADFFFAQTTSPEGPQFTAPTVPSQPEFDGPTLPSVPEFSAPEFAAPSLPSEPQLAAPSLPSLPELAAPTVPSVPEFAAPTLPSVPEVAALELAAPALPTADPDAFFNVATTLPVPTTLLTLPSPLPNLLDPNMNPSFALPPPFSLHFNPLNSDSLDPSAPLPLPIPETCIGQTPGSGCSAEGAWHCFCDGTSFQRCGSGVWSNVLHVASGASCEPGYFRNRLIMYVDAEVGGVVERVGDGRGGVLMVERKVVEVEAAL